MVESKSGHFTNDFKAFSEKVAEFAPRCINRLAADSERQSASTATRTLFWKSDRL
jgi:hypothetical protein